jgi:hypothetical protein
MFWVSVTVDVCIFVTIDTDIFRYSVLSGKIFFPNHTIVSPSFLSGFGATSTTVVLSE